MKIIVTHKDKSTEIITLTEPIEIVRGEKLNKLVTSTGMEHWFNEEGFYDGWGMHVSNVSVQDADAIIQRYENERER